MAFKHGYSLSLSHWQSSLQVLLEKKPGSIYVADLHSLGLLNAEFNASMKIMVDHHMVQQALQANLIPLECYGSVPGCCTTEVSFICCLLADVSCQHHQPLAVACDDFSHCYNQVAHCPASLACQCLGITTEIMSTIFFSIHFMKFYCRTAYSDSTTFYSGGLSQHPFQGVCQGNGADLATWLVLCLCLIHIIHQFGSPNRSPLQSCLQALSWCVWCVYLHR